MSYITANTLPVSEARLVFPLTGAWHADLLVASADAITGACSIDLGGDLTLTGSVLTGGNYTETLHLRVIAGNGGWVKACAPKYYQNATLGTILVDLLSQGGESLSSTSDAAARAVNITAFPSTAGSVGANVRALMNYAPDGTSWRFLTEGTFWIGPEAWPAFTADYSVTNEEPRELRLDVGFESPTLLAGQSVQASSGTVDVNRVETTIDADGFRARVWWQS